MLGSFLRSSQTAMSRSCMSAKISGDDDAGIRRRTTTAATTAAAATTTAATTTTATTTRLTASWWGVHLERLDLFGSGITGVWPQDKRKFELGDSKHSLSFLSRFFTKIDHTDPYRSSESKGSLDLDPFQQVLGPCDLDRCVKLQELANPPMRHMEEKSSMDCMEVPFVTFPHFITFTFWLEMKAFVLWEAKLQRVRDIVDQSGVEGAGMGISKCFLDSSKWLRTTA